MKRLLLPLLCAVWLLGYILYVKGDKHKNASMQKMYDPTEIKDPCDCPKCNQYLKQNPKPPKHLPLTRSIKTYIVEKQKAKAHALSGWMFSPKHWQLYEAELSDWTKNYLPVDIRGKTVLNVGAGDGETAKFFLEHGASKVICVECDPERYRYLFANAKVHSELVVVPCRFDVAMLSRFRFDFLQMDIEGYEQALLDNGVRLNVPAVVEVHGLQLRDRFAEVGYRIGKRLGAVDYWTCYAFWRC